ncbi:MAG: GTP cyclohydrolase II RibA [Ectothiorhodospiraceae bacterium]
MQQAERAIFDLRRGQPLLIGDDATGIICLAAEDLTDAGLARLRRIAPNSAAGLVVTPNRARALDLAADPTVALHIDLRADATPTAIRALADATRDAAPPERAQTRPADAAEAGAVNLARAARLLPAVITLRPTAADAEAVAGLERDGTLLRITPADAGAVPSAPQLEPIPVTDARIPLADADTTRFVLFRETNGLHEHIAVLIGEPGNWPDPVPVRLHSACLTGDLFGSLRCDCGEQLRNSVRTIDAAGGGVLLYLAQEGRGIGLANKLRAYNLQDNGMDTLEANCCLGFSADERHYDAAVSMLQHLDIHRVSLLTNNPLKVEALEVGGIQVVARESLHGSLNPHNVRYLSTKSERSGHWLDDLLDRALPDD